MSDLLSRFIYWVSGGRLVHRDNIPLARIIVDASATFEAKYVRFENVQLVLREDSNHRIEFCYFTMTELAALGLDYTTIAAPIGETDD